ncbi:integral membrane protein [Streptococcus pneumoniae]|nr:integral membrane protein [Streptococcus pneumoniae]CWD46860.1 integral membrane protein [Streptococcus pneumoniae]VLJ38171.1 integral membrane protein [Streptococcus pneumoniae]VOW34501.1 integral membrane protein [Streptococcus pneumoniae]VOX86839.1 integral membrane protein [Streptococcus pneumoniae]
MESNLKKTTFIIVMIGISLIPALYNIIFLSLMWDPYGQLSDLPVAVVNNDKEASYNGNTMAIGKDMVSNLKENKTLDFHFVDEEEGKKGLEDGDYYMVVTLPSDLSKKTTTLSNIQSTAAYQSLTSEQQTGISDSVSQNSTDSIQSAQSIVALVQGLQGSLENLQNQSSNLSTLKNQANQVLPITSTSLIGLSSGLTEIQGAVTSKLVPASQLIASGVNAYTTGVDKVSQGASQLSEKNATLTQKSSRLTAGVDKLQSGSGQLADKSSQLLSGASSLENGANKLADGSGKLAEGGTKLTSGLEDLQTGLASLGQGLGNASDQLKSVSTESKNAEILSNPLNLSKTDNDQVLVNGIAIAPYMISVALFVAAISTNMIFSKLPSGRHPEIRWAWLKSRAEINGIIAVLAGILVYGGVHLIGLTANHEMRIFILIILTSLVFMSMVTTLTTWNSRIGAFFSLILLLLQLASSAGTYPLALTNDFFKSINPWLPMSYSVSGLRQTISINKSFS